MSAGLYLSDEKLSAQTTRMQKIVDDRKVQNFADF